MLSSRIFADRRFFIWLLILLPILVKLPALLGYWNPDPSLFVGGLGDHFKFKGSYPWIDPNVGFQAQALGKLSADQWLSAQVPWWNSYTGVGLPLVAEAQPGSFFLPFVLLYHFRAGGLWVEVILQIIAGLATYTLLRRLRLTALASLAGAILFEFNGTFAWHGSPIVAPMAFLPLLLLGVEQLRERIAGGDYGCSLLIPLALAWSIYAGFPETAYIDGLFTGLWVIARLGGLSRRQQLVFSGSLLGAVLVGLLCSLPMLGPFAEYLDRAYVGGHDGAIAHVALPGASSLLSLMPWLFGPIDRFNDQAPLIGAVWGKIGGYFTALQLAFAIVGMMYAPRRLTAALLVWMLLCLAKTFDWRPLSDLINVLPMVKSAAFFRYSDPSWEFAGAVMVALCIDGLQRDIPSSYKRQLFVFATVLIGIGSGLWFERRLIEDLFLNVNYKPYFYWSVFWLLFSLFVGMGLIGLRNRWRHCAEMIVILLCIDSFFAFSLPIYSGGQNAVTEEPGVNFLKDHIGLQRAYSIGPLAPNYGAYFRIAQINHNYLPVSQDWIDYIHKHIDPSADEITFIGEYPRKDHVISVEEDLAERQPGYEELGVKYVLSNHDKNPFVKLLNTDIGDGGNRPLPLQDGQVAVLHWTVPSSPSVRHISEMNITIGNYNNHADGVLAARLCIENGACVVGRHDLRESADNAALRIPLDQSLVLPSAIPVRLSIKLSHEQSSSPVVIWIWPIAPGSSQQLTLDKEETGFAPAVGLQLAHLIQGGHRENLVYSGQDMDIYELTDAKPYFEVEGGPCVERKVSRLAIDLLCQAAAKLTRREAYYPGWRASINGEDAPVERANEIFQRINLAAGRQRVVFIYRPTHFAILLFGFGLGVTCLLYLAWRDLRELSRRRTAYKYGLHR
jgi:hypothetical protein